MRSQSLSRAEKIYQWLFVFYPERYLKRFGQEMKQVFKDHYLEQGGRSLVFWPKIIIDAVSSGVQEHVDSLQKEGLKDYFQNTLHINKFNLVGGLLLLPFSLMFFLDFFFRIVQGNLARQNPTLYNALQSTQLYSMPILFTWVFIFPALAILINLVPFVTQLTSGRVNVSSATVVRRNIFSFALVGVGLSFLVLMAWHDFAPCMLWGMVSKGLGNVLPLLERCRNA